MVHCSTDKRRFRILEDHIADLHVLIIETDLEKCHTKSDPFFVLSSFFSHEKPCPFDWISSPAEAVAQDHNYATERLSLALAEAEELDDFLRQMKGSELLGRFFWGSWGRDESGGSRCSYPVWKGQGNGSKMHNVIGDVGGRWSKHLHFLWLWG